MRMGKKGPEIAPPQPKSATPARPAWRDLVDSEERPSREDRATYHTAIESILEPVPMPRWLRGHRRAPSDRLS